MGVSRSHGVLPLVEEWTKSWTPLGGFIVDPLVGVVLTGGQQDTSPLWGFVSGILPGCGSQNRNFKMACPGKWNMGQNLRFAPPIV